MADGGFDSNSHGSDVDNRESSTISSTNSGNNDCGSASNTSVSIPASPSLRFTGVQLYFFRRKQGFNCVPTKGGTTLGMAEKHFDEHRVSFDSGHGEDEINDNDDESDTSYSSDNEVDSDRAVCSSNTRKRSFSPIPEKCSLAELRPLPVRQRRRLLRLSGVKKIDTTERFECEAIRLSRNECGCQTCGAVCLPDVCPCSVNGIACQVDKMAYPCSCTREGCRNVEGRVEFNANRVRRHLIHTLTKLYAANEASSEDSGAVEDESMIVDDNCDNWGRCRFCNMQEPLKFHHHNHQGQQLCQGHDMSEPSSAGADSAEEPRSNVTSCRQSSAAVVASKMLRRKLARHWRQQAQSASTKTANSSRVVNKLILMRRAMLSEKASDHHEADAHGLGNE